MRKHRLVGGVCAFALSAVACGRTAAPGPSAAPSAPSAPSAPPPAAPSSPPATEPPPPATPPPIAPALGSPAWTPIALTEATCSGGDDDCFTVTLPARGFLALEGHTPHHWGCANLDGGVLVAKIERRVVAAAMTAPEHAGIGSGQCRAHVVFRGQGTIGPLDAGTWLLVPAAYNQIQPDHLAPLHLDDVKFAPSAP